MRRAAILAALVGACAAPHASTPMPAPTSAEMPGPGPRARADAVAQNRACEGCHAGAASTWRASLHAGAFTDPVFAQAFAKEPAPMCRNCHAPEPSEAIGVACTTCHDPAGTGEVLAAPKDAVAKAPHAIRREAAFAGTAACARCHEFPFPDPEGRRRDLAKMQRTVSEHASSRFAKTACATCHMKAGSHAFTPELDAAVVTKAERHGQRLVVHLAPGAIGHAFPTGDLFRRVLVVAEAIDDDWQLLAHAERPLARHFRFEEGIQREISDDRVIRDTEVELDLGPRARGKDIVWRVEYQRVANMQGDRAEIASRAIVAEGRSTEEP